MAKRIVIVEFESEVTPREVAEFSGWLRELAANTPSLISMTCGEHYAATGEAALSASAPSVVFGNFASIWEFDDERALDEFVMQPFHRAMAGQKFRKFIRRRYVANIV